MEWTGMSMKQIEVSFPILEDFAIQQEWVFCHYQ